MFLRAQKTETIRKALEKRKNQLIAMISVRFIWWHVIAEYGKYTTEEMYAVYRKLHESIDLIKGGMTRERICVSYVRALFPLTIAKEIKTVFGLANRTEKVSSMTDQK